MNLRPPAPFKTGLKRHPVEWLSAYDNSKKNGDRPKSLLDMADFRGWVKRQEEEAYNERDGEYQSCFRRVAFMTRLQQFCGVGFPRKFGDDCVPSRSPSCHIGQQ